jgi:hypothetical protein
MLLLKTTYICRHNHDIYLPVVVASHIIICCVSFIFDGKFECTMF